MSLNSFAKYNLRSVIIRLNGKQDTQNEIRLEATEIFLLILYFYFLRSRVKFLNSCLPQIFPYAIWKDLFFFWYDGLTQYNRRLLGVRASWRHWSVYYDVRSSLLLLKENLWVTQCWVDSYLLSWPFPTICHLLAGKTGSLPYFHTSA